MSIKYLVYENQDDANTKKEIIINNNDNIPSEYTMIIQHPSLLEWAFPIHPFYLEYFTEDEINLSTTLTPDWYL